MPIIKEDVMHKYDAASFDFNNVKANVSDSMQEEWKYKMVDNAKKRAIHDCKNYDDFKQRVATCTLKPIHKHEFNEPPKFRYNNNSTKLGLASIACDAKPSFQQLEVFSTCLNGEARVAPRNLREFERELRRAVASAEKVALVSCLDERQCKQLFKHEIDPEALRDLLNAFKESGDSGARSFLALLSSSCPCSTSTSASFLSRAERNVVLELLALQPAEVEDHQICSVFGVDPEVLEASRIMHSTVTASTDNTSGKATIQPVNEHCSFSELD